MTIHKDLIARALQLSRLQYTMTIQLFFWQQMWMKYWLKCPSLKCNIRPNITDHRIFFWIEAHWPSTINSDIPEIMNSITPVIGENLLCHWNNVIGVFLYWLVLRTSGRHQLLVGTELNAWLILITFTLRITWLDKSY